MFDFYPNTGDSLKNKIHWDYDVAEYDVTKGRVATPESLVARVEKEAERFGMQNDSLAVISPTSLHIGDVQVTWNEEDERQKKQKLNDLKSRVSTVPGIPNVDNKRVIRIGATSNSIQDSGAFVNRFVRTMHSYNERHQDNAANFQTFERINNTPSVGFESALHGVTNSITNNITRTPTLDDQIASVTPDLSRRPDNSNECGLFDNRPEVLVPQITDYETVSDQIESSLPYFERLPVVQYPLEVTEVAPQLISEDFPTGGIFDQSLAVLTLDGNPLTINQLRNVRSFDTDRLNLEPLNRVMNNKINDSMKSQLGAKFPNSEIQSTYREFKVDISTQIPNTEMATFDRAPTQLGTPGGGVRTSTTAIPTQNMTAASVGSAAAMGSTAARSPSTTALPTTGTRLPATTTTTSRRMPSMPSGGSFRGGGY